MNNYEPSHCLSEWKGFLANGKTFGWALLLTLLSWGLPAQDIHYAQTGNSALNLNPGLTGVFGGNHRFAANYRRQWSSVPVPYRQFSGAYDIRFSTQKERLTPWSAGMIFNHDQAGDGKLSLAHLGFSGSYTERLSPQKRLYLTFGVMAGVIERDFLPDDLTYDDQYDTETGFSDLNPSGESVDNASKMMGDLSMGLNLHGQSQKNRSNFDLGAGIFHFNEPKKNFFTEETARLRARLSVYALATLEVATRLDLLLSGTAQFQGDYQETVAGLSGLYHLSTKKTQELGLQLGLFFRPGDAWIPTAGLHYQDWRVQVSFDLNTSPLRQASLRRGGPEVSVIYILKHVQPIEFCKNCPVYM